MSNRFKAVGLFCRALWGEFSLPCRPILQFFSENFNFFLLFSECFQFSCSQFPVGLRGFFVFSGSFQFVFRFSILYLLIIIRRISTMSIIIGIDHGYYAIKTAHCSFPAGLTSYGEHEPYTRQGLLEFGGCFFVCGSGRQPIQRDKTANDKFVHLSNFYIDYLPHWNALFILYCHPLHPALLPVSFLRSLPVNSTVVLRNSNSF